MFEEKDATIYHFPAQTTKIIGRDSELRVISELLCDSRVRLVTLLAPGGMGKTCLAMVLGHQELTRYRDGCCFVPLASIASVDGIIPAIAKALKQTLRYGNDPLEQLQEYLRSRQLLLVLDNFEHLLGAADLITRILEATPCIQILVTSRQKLNITFETVYRLEQLDIPHHANKTQSRSYGSVQLFLHHAAQLRPEWQPSQSDLKKIVHICTLVAGMPLAIILATQWLNTLSLDDIVAEIQHDLDFLNANMLDIPERLHSIRAVFEGTWKHMPIEERQAFQRLSVFRGGGKRDAFQHVAGVSLHVIQHLVHRALMVYTDTGRYEIHELLRQYAEKRLMQDEEAYNLVRERHSRYFASFTLQQYEGLHVSETIQWLNIIDVELENLQYGWDWAIRNTDQDALWQYSKLYLYYSLRCRYLEGEAILARTVEAIKSKVANEQLSLLHARALAFHVYLCHYNIELDKMLNSYRQCIAILREFDELGKNRETVAILYFLGSSMYVSHPDEARQLLEECIGYCEQYNHHDALMVAARMNRLGFLPSLETEVDEIEAGLQHAQQLNYVRGQAIFTRYRAMLGYWVEQNYALASKWMEQSIDLHRRCGDTLNLAGALVTAADIELARHHYDNAHQRLLDALSLFDEVGCLPWLLRPTLICTARLLFRLNALPAAAELCACVQFMSCLTHPHITSINLIWNADIQPLWKSVKTELNGTILNSAVEAGASLTLATAVKRSLELLNKVDPASIMTTIEVRMLRVNAQLINPITQREFEVFLLICEGNSNRAIADQLSISKNTLKTHIRRLYDKLNVENRSQAILRGQVLSLLEA